MAFGKKSKGVFLTLPILFLLIAGAYGQGQCLSVNIGVIIDQHANPCNGPVTLDAKYPGFNYTWNTGATTQKIVVTASDTFIVVVDNGMGCSGTDTITVTFLDVPTINLGADPAPQCGGCLVLDPGGDPGLNYLWNTGATSPSITYCKTGTEKVSVKVTNSVGCSVSDTVEVTITPGIDVDLGPDISTCEEDINLSTGLTGVSHLWNTGESTESITVNSSASYYVDVNDGAGCVGSDTVLVTFLPRPDVDLGADPAAKCGGCISLDAGNDPSLSYQWSTGQTSSKINYCQTGTNNVIVTVTNSNNCTDKDTISTTIHPGYEADLGDDITVCNEEVTLTAPEFPNATYLWNTGATTRDIQVTSAGNYWVAIRDINGCSTLDTLTDTINVFYDTPLPSPSVITDQSNCNEKKYAIDPIAGASSYIWEVPAGCTITGGQGTPSITVSVYGNVAGAITVTASNGTTSCNSSETSLVVNLGDHPLSIPNAFTPNNDGQNDTWVIRNLELYPDNELVVLNRWGNEVYRQKNYKGDWNGSNLNEGTYFYKFRVRFCDEEKSISDYVTIVR